MNILWRSCQHRMSTIALLCPSSASSMLSSCLALGCQTTFQPHLKPHAQISSISNPVPCPLGSQTTSQIPSTPANLYAAQSDMLMSCEYPSFRRQWRRPQTQQGGLTITMWRSADYRGPGQRRGRGNERRGGHSRVVLMPPEGRHVTPHVGAEGPQFARTCTFYTKCHSVYPYNSPVVPLDHRNCGP